MDISTYQAPANCLQDRVILITGASRGIGKAVAMECARLGATVLLLAKTLDRLEKVYDEIIALNLAQPAILNTDLEIAGAEDYLKVASAIQEEYGRLDGLLHNAGRVGGLTPLAQTPLENWSHLISLHLHAPFLLTNACLPLLRKSKDASILFTVDETNKAFWGAYGVSKAGQLSLLSILADELDGDKKIRVNGIHPGKVRTDLRTHNYPGVNPKEFTPAEEITSPFIYFLGADSKGTTNTVYRANKK
jgi:NAD(P)-dependent dehydrogenase (short-subunit alcohol dehydrogenase family)